MHCRLCDQDVLNGQEFVPIHVRSEELREGYVLPRIDLVGAVHFECLWGVFERAVQDPEAAEEEPEDITLNEELGYCGAVGCMARVYASAEGPRCTAGHVTDPLDKPYREGDQD